jgi:hypothetical protein
MVFAEPGGLIPAVRHLADDRDVVVDPHAAAAISTAPLGTEEARALYASANANANATEVVGVGSDGFK